MIFRLLNAGIKGMILEFGKQNNERLHRKYSKLWTNKWNSDINWIMEQIKKDYTTDSNALFKWNQLMGQEFEMWSMLARPVTIKEIDMLSEIRGFTNIQRNYIVDMTRHMGILVEVSL